jgi:hypothetical protein
MHCLAQHADTALQFNFYQATLIIVENRGVKFPLDK